MKLTQRSIKPDLFTDGRLLGVSLQARMLALALEALAYPTGCVLHDVRAIRAAAGGWLAMDADGDPPRPADVECLLAELLAAKWTVEDENQQPPVLYLKGFGDRQQSQYVYVGVAHDEKLQPHLITPCVEVHVVNVTQREGGKPCLRGFPEHCCEPVSSCPCDKVSRHSPDQRKRGSGRSSGSGSAREG